MINIKDQVTIWMKTECGKTKAYFSLGFYEICNSLKTLSYCTDRVVNFYLL